MDHRGLREQDAISLVMARRPVCGSHGTAVLGGMEIAAPLGKSPLRASTGLGCGGRAEKRTHADSPTAIAITSPAGWRSTPGTVVAAIASGRSVASNSVGVRYASAECRRWRL